MPAPLLTALGYFLGPRAVGMAADKAMQSRAESLLAEATASGASKEEIEHTFNSDPYLRVLSLLPRQSGIESTISSLKDLYNGNPYGTPRSEIPAPGALSSPDGRTIDEIIAGRGLSDPSVQPQYYLPENSRGQTEFITPMDDFLKYGGRDIDDAGQLARYARNSYGQTDQPATEVRFDDVGGANGGLAALLRNHYAQYKR
jgi:hypothetical protein